MYTVGSDRKVRSADIEYKIPGESRFRVTTRPIHKLLLVVPVEEQTMGKEESREEIEEEGETDPGKQRRATGVLDQASPRETGEMIRARGPAAGSPEEPDLEEVKKKP